MSQHRNNEFPEPASDVYQLFGTVRVLKKGEREKKQFQHPSL